MKYALKAAIPGERFGIEVVLVSKTETPVDFIETTLRGVETAIVGEGKGQYQREFEVLRQQARETPKVLTPGERRYPYSLDLPRSAPPSYRGVRASLVYSIAVHVSIPWWPDRRVEYGLPVLALPPASPLAITPRLGASAQGPQPGKVYAEVSVDRDVLEPGGVLVGAVSVSNTGASRVRRVLATLTTTETITAPAQAAASLDRMSVLLCHGSPPEGEAIPFRLRVPEGVPATFVAGAFRLDWCLVVRVDVAFAADAVAVIPLVVVRTPPGATPRPPGRYYPVGRDRFSLVWASVSKKLGMALDADGRTLRSSAGEASLAVQAAYDGKAYTLRVELAWPSLGIGLFVRTRSWMDIAGWKSPSQAAQEHLVIRGREPEQLAAILDEPLLDVLATYTSVSVDDEHATLELGIPGTNAPELEEVCRSALSILKRVAHWPELTPPPRTVAPLVDAWRAFARNASGSLETGSLSLRHCSLGVDRYSVETHWVATDQALEMVVTFPLDPPLEDEPALDSPSLTQEARDLWQGVEQQTTDLEVTREQLTWRAPPPGAVGDPATLLPAIEQTGRLVRALRRGVSAGPYR